MIELIEAADALSDVLEDLILREDWVTINGQHIDIGAGGEGVPLSKSDLAKLAYRGGTKHEQDIAEDSEKRLAEGLGMARTKDNSPFDLQEGKIGIEIKTFVSNTNDKCTQKAEAMARKVEAIKASKLTKTFTVVADRRGDLAASPKYYVRDGFGSFRLGTMKEVTIPELKLYINKRGTGRFSL